VIGGKEHSLKTETGVQKRRSMTEAGATRSLFSEKGVNGTVKQKAVFPKEHSQTEKGEMEGPSSQLQNSSVRTHVCEQRTYRQDGTNSLRASCRDLGEKAEQFADSPRAKKKGEEVEGKVPGWSFSREPVRGWATRPTTSRGDLTWPGGGGKGGVTIFIQNR